jgi:hypothetical protein
LFIRLKDEIARQYFSQQAYLSGAYFRFIALDVRVRAHRPPRNLRELARVFAWNRSLGLWR